MVAVAGILAAALIALAPDAGASDAGSPDAGAPDAAVSASGAAGDMGAPVEPLGANGPIDCGAPNRAPSPSCGESLDGRDPPPTSPARRAAQVVLAPPRTAARLAFIPVVEATAVVERRSLMPWMTALTTSDDGKVGVRPQLQYATGFIPSIGLGMFYRRFPDPGSEVTARFRVGSTDVWRVEGGLHGPAWLGLSVGGMWDRRDDRIFAGIGVQPVDAPNVKARYGGDIYKVEATWAAPRARLVSLQLRAGAEGRNYHSNDVRGGPSVADAYGASPETCAALGAPSPCTDPAQLPGFYGGRRLLYQRARVALDLRPGGRDRSGVEIGLDGTYVQGIINDRSRHVRTVFDAVGAIGGIDRALLLRFAAGVVQPVGRCARPVRRDDLADRGAVEPRPARRAAARSQRRSRHGGIPLADLVRARCVAVHRRKRGGQRLVRGTRRPMLSAPVSASACASTGAVFRATGRMRPRAACSSRSPAARASAFC